MASLHMLGHMVAMAIIATLLKQIMELNSEVNKLREQLEDKKETKNCSYDSAEDQQDKKSSAVEPADDRENTSGEEEIISTTDQSDSEENTAEVKLKIGDAYDLSQPSEPPEHIPFVTSASCHEGFNQLCQFENLCYSSITEDFVLFQHESSVLENVRMEDGSLNVDLSTVKNHNTQQASVVSLPSEIFHTFQVNWVNETTLVFRPFLPDNLMHMFHDDIIPLHHTLKLIYLWTGKSNSFHSHDPYDIQLFLVEDNSVMSEESEEVYAIFSKHRLKWKDSYKFGSGLTCFKSVFIGLSKTSTWYDYGFTKPQGPISNHQAEGKFVRHTADFIRHNIPMSGFSLKSQEFIVLLSRHENRRIINKENLILDVIKATEMKVVLLNYESYSLQELIWYVSHSKGIIAMHGSLLMLGMFLKPGSFVIELYPYAVSPSNYTPYKTLAELSGMGLLYQAWANKFKSNSVGHPDWPAELGGLNHLEERQRETILAQQEIPVHLCCSDPSWLYHIYQDTVVNTSEISVLVMEAVQKGLANGSERMQKLFHPSRVQNIVCSFKNGSERTEDKEKPVLILHWDIPWTISYLNVQEVYYEILLQSCQKQSESVLSFQTKQTSMTANVEMVEDYNVWIRCVVNKNLASPYRNAVCHNEKE